MSGSPINWEIGVSKRLHKEVQGYMGFRALISTNEDCSVLGSTLGPLFTQATKVILWRVGLGAGLLGKLGCIWSHGPPIIPLYPLDSKGQPSFRNWFM